MAEELVSALLGAFLVGAGVITGGKTIDIVGDGRTVTNPDICILSVQNSGNPDGGKPKECSVVVNCKDSPESKHDITHMCSDTSGSYDFDDAAIGHVTIKWGESSPTNQAPYPGPVIAEVPAYTITQGTEKSNRFVMSDCRQDNSQDIAVGTDCDDKQVKFHICNQGYPDGKSRDLMPETLRTYGYNYYMAIPKKGMSKQMACATQSVGVTKPSHTVDVWKHLEAPK